MVEHYRIVNSEDRFSRDTALPITCISLNHHFNTCPAEPGLIRFGEKTVDPEQIYPFFGEKTVDPDHLIRINSAFHSD